MLLWYAVIWFSFGVISVMFSKRKKIMKFLIPLTMFLSTAFCVAGIFKEDEFKLIPPIIIGIMSFSILIYLTTFKLGQHIPDMILLIFQKDQLKKFKQIFDNLEESIFIIDKKNKQIKYANKFFFQ